MFPLADE